MKELFLGECRHFRTMALVAGAVHLMLLQLASRLADPLQQGWQLQSLFLSASALAGLAFAAVQFSGYRQPSRWVWLMHRPLTRGRIFGALSLAALALLVVVIALPALLVLAGLDHYTGRTVDTRHYLIPLHLLLASLSAWFAGAYLMLCGRRAAFVVLFVPAVLSAHLASGAALLLPALAGLAMVAALAYTSFKPDRTAPPASALGQAAAGIPLVLGFYCLLLWGGSFGFQYGQMLFGVHPLNRPLPPAGGFTELVRADGASNLRRALAAADDPRAAHWRRQLALLDVGAVQPEGRQHAVRGQIANLDKTQWVDGRRNILWTFNHDRMLFEGRDRHTDAPRGWFGLGGMDDLRSFDTVPVMPGKFFMTRQHLLQLDADASRARTLVTLRAPETLTGGLQEVGRQPFVLTNQRLIALRRPADPQAPLEQLYSVPLPGPFSDLARVDVARLLDGTLLSFGFGRDMADGAIGSRQHVLFVDPSGRAQPIVARELAPDFPLLFAHKEWWLSPLSKAVLDLPGRLLDKGLIEDLPEPAAQARPPAVIAAAILAALLCTALAAWRLRGHLPRHRLAWSAAALAFGPPGAAALWLLAPRPAPQAASEPQAAQPIPAAA